MKKHLITSLAIMTSLLCASAYAAPGEYWEITSKMEMPGMPFAMPANTQKTCIPKGAENDPSKSAGDKDCQMSDIKTVGNKTSWKARCDRDGEVMIGVGEQTTSADGYDGKITFSGKSEGEDMNMKMAYSGKRLGGSCDTEEMANKIKSQVCDSSHLKTTIEWVNNASQFLSTGIPCPKQKKELCSRVRKEAPTDAEVYSAMVTSDSQINTHIAQECGMDMAATTIAVCKTLSGENVRTLSPYCPQEAKLYREEQRRKDCEGRSYTASSRAADFAKCMGGKGMGNSDEDSQNDSMPSTTSPPSASPNAETPPSAGNPAQEILDTAKKLKGFFGR
ncbi:MAG: DUF3617 family protein [Desulfobulbaceae bacterium]|nr:DUF3617 family protein [Desulfobulbaceae bacterium]